MRQAVTRQQTMTELSFLSAACFTHDSKSKCPLQRNPLAGC